MFGTIVRRVHKPTLAQLAFTNILNKTSAINLKWREYMIQFNKKMLTSQPICH
jgi:hypothetical protein